MMYENRYGCVLKDGCIQRDESFQKFGTFWNDIIYYVYWKIGALEGWLFPKYGCFWDDGCEG